MNRFIGIDFGMSKVGLAISDPSRIISMPLKVLRYKNSKNLIYDLQAIALENNVDTFVVGYPLNMNNEKNEMTSLVENFKDELISLGFKVFL